MKILPVLDLKEGVVVRGVAGRREEYRPIVSRWCNDPSPASVARGLREAFGFDECYVADLDAIATGRPNYEVYRDIELTGLRAWVDAGLALSVPRTPSRFDDFITPWRAILSLESLADEMLAFTCEARDDVFVFSLDLMNGRPLTKIPALATTPPEVIASQWIDCGVRSMIVLDLAGVGVGQGVPTLDLCRRLRAKYPKLELISGGGVRGLDDLKALRDAGCNAALVASALHDGRIMPSDLQAGL